MTWRDEADHAEIGAIIAVGEGLKKRNLFVGEGLAAPHRQKRKSAAPSEPVADQTSNSAGANPKNKPNNRQRRRPAEQLRHPVASTLLSRGAPLLYVQAVGGWRSAGVLLKTHSRWMDTGLGVPGQPAATPAQPRQGNGRLTR